MTFWDEALPYAREAHDATGVLTSVILAQWADETGYGGPDWSVDHNPGNVGSYDGHPVNSFPSLAAGVQAYIQTMHLGYYDAVRNAPDWQSQARALGSSPWASAHYIGNPPANYPGGSLVEIIQSNNLTQYDHAAPTPPAPAPKPQPQMEDDDMAYPIIVKSQAGAWLILGPTRPAVGIPDGPDLAGLQAAEIPVTGELTTGMAAAINSAVAAPVA